MPSEKRTDHGHATGLWFSTNRLWPREASHYFNFTTTRRPKCTVAVSGHESQGYLFAATRVVTSSLVVYYSW